MSSLSCQNQEDLHGSFFCEVCDSNKIVRTGFPVGSGKRYLVTATSCVLSAVKINKIEIIASEMCEHSFKD